MEVKFAISITQDIVSSKQIVSFSTLNKDVKGNAVAKTVEKDTLSTVRLEKSVEDKFHVSTDTTMNQQRAI